MTAPHKQEQEHRLRHSHTTHCIQMLIPHLTVEIKNHLPSMLTHGPLYFINTTHLYSTGTLTVPQTGTAFLSSHLIITISLGQTHLMDTKINHCEESHCLGHSDPNKMFEMFELQVTVTSHPQVIVTLVWVNNPTSEGLPHTKPGIYWVNRLNSKPTRLCTVMTTLHILHPTLGIACALLNKEGQVPISTLPFKHAILFVPAPAILFLPFSSLLLSQTLNNPAITLAHQSSDTEHWHAMTTHSPTVHVGKQNNV